VCWICSFAHTAAWAAVRSRRLGLGTRLWRVGTEIRVLRWPAYIASFSEWHPDMDLRSQRSRS